MSDQTALILKWSPRTLSIFFAFFISLFALDVFGENIGFWNIAFALFMHLIPTYLVVIVLFLSWKRQWIGGIVYNLLGLLYMMTLFKRPMHWLAYILISGPLFFIGILFLLDWRQCKKAAVPSLD